MRNRWLLIAGLAVPLVVAVGIWLAQGASEPRAARTPSQAGPTRAWEHLVDKGVRESRSVDLRHWPFAHVESTGKGMPFALRREAKEVLGNPDHLGLRFEHARHAVTANKVDLWVVQATGVLCMFRAKEIAATCETTAEAYRHGLVLQIYKLDEAHGRRPTKFAALGIAPDGVKEVPAKVGKRRISIPVAANAYFAEAPMPIAVLLRAIEPEPSPSQAGP